MQRVRIAFAALVIATLSACAHAAPTTTSCPSSETSAIAVAETMREMYAALKADDLEGFQAVTTKNFFAFDAGKRFDGEALVGLIKTAHERGAVYDWQVVDPKVDVACDMALVTYINNGSLTEAGSTRALSWLESATLTFDAQRWRIRFFHSTRVPQP